MKHFAWCTYCGKRYTEEETEKFEGPECPACKSEGVPCFTKRDVMVEINWHELHLLCVWAENYQQQLEDFQEPTVAAIARRLLMQHPKLGPLTLGGEIHEIKSMPEVSGVETNIPGPPLLVVNGNGAVGCVKEK